MIDNKVSVIIPAFNRGKYIRQTVDSVLNQTYPNFELIVVDDGSTDDTRQILEEYGERIRIGEHPQRANRGQSASINLGLEYANGEYVAILDSDDYWEPDKLEAQVAYLEKHPDIGLVYGNGTAVNENGDFLYDIFAPGHQERNIPDNVLLDCYFLVPNNSLVRGEVFEKTGGFDESLRSAQDHDMGIRIAEVARLGYIDKPVYHYRRHSESISSKKADLRWINGFVILDKARKRYPYPLSTVIRRKAVLHFRLFQIYIEKKQFSRAVQHLILAGIYDPMRAFRVLMKNKTISSPH